MSITAYWISPLGEHHPVPTTHINFITDNPDLFGLTTAGINAEYDKQNENTKNPAEDVIIASLQEKGWIRIQYDAEKWLWEIRYSVPINSIKARLYKWIKQDDILVAKPNFRFIHSNYKPTFIYNREIEKFLTVKNYEIEESCLSCTHSTWAVALGQGFFCRNVDKMDQGGDRVSVSSSGFRRFNIPNRNYICEFYEKKNCSCSLRRKEEK